MASQKNFHALGDRIYAGSVSPMPSGRHAGCGSRRRWFDCLCSLPIRTLAVIAGSAHNATPTNPTSALPVEVSDAALSYDRGLKAELYAHISMQDYWILNLVQRQLKVLRVPVADGGRHLGFVSRRSKTILLRRSYRSPGAVAARSNQGRQHASLTCRRSTAPWHHPAAIWLRLRPTPRAHFEELLRVMDRLAQLLHALAYARQGLRVTACLTNASGITAAWHPPKEVRRLCSRWLWGVSAAVAE